MWIETETHELLNTNAIDRIAVKKRNIGRRKCKAEIYSVVAYLRNEPEHRLIYDDWSVHNANNIITLIACRIQDKQDILKIGDIERALNQE